MVKIDLDGKVAIVVGSGRGIGRAIALKLAEAGADVVVSDIVKENAEAVAEEVKAMGRRSKAYSVNVADATAMETMVDEVAAEFGHLDIMCNNAGVNVIKLFADSDISEFNKIVDINLKGVYNGCKAAVKHMIPQGYGRIVNTASQAAKAPFDYHSMYSATKYGVLGMTQVISKEISRYGVTLNCLCPGIVRTEMWEQNLREYDGYDNSITPEERWEKVVANIPTRRPQTPEDMANAVLFLVSDLAENITGQGLNVNGGQVCY